MSCRISSNELLQGVCIPLCMKVTMIGGEETDNRDLPVSCLALLTKTVLEYSWPPLSCAFAWAWLTIDSKGTNHTHLPL